MTRDSLLVDSHGRVLRDLRVSITDRCNYRCVYCMPEHMSFLPKGDLLTLEELERLCTAFIAKGVERLRITGVPAGVYDARLIDVKGRTCTVRNLKIEPGQIFSIEEKELSSCK